MFKTCQTTGLVIYSPGEQIKAKVEDEDERGRKNDRHEKCVWYIRLRKMRNASGTNEMDVGRGRERLRWRRGGEFRVSIWPSRRVEFNESQFDHCVSFPWFRGTIYSLSLSLSPSLSLPLLSLQLVPNCHLECLLFLPRDSWTVLLLQPLTHYSCVITNQLLWWH